MNYLGLNCQVVCSLVLFYHPSCLLVFLISLLILTHLLYSHLLTTLTHKLNSQISFSSSKLCSQFQTCRAPFHLTFLFECSISYSHSLHSKPNTSFLFPKALPPQKKAPSPLSVFSILKNVNLTKPEISLFLAQYLTNYQILYTS